jgi:hypothetical protein
MKTNQQHFKINKALINKKNNHNNYFFQVSIITSPWPATEISTYHNSMSQHQFALMPAPYHHIFHLKTKKNTQIHHSFLPCNCLLLWFHIQWPVANPSSAHWVFPSQNEFASPLFCMRVTTATTAMVCIYWWDPTKMWRNWRTQSSMIVNQSGWHFGIKITRVTSEENHKLTNK